MEAQHSIEAGLALPLAGGPLAFGAIDVFWRTGLTARQSFRFGLPAAFKNWLSSVSGDLKAIADRQFSSLQQPRPGLGQIGAEGEKRPLVMGIVNVTPDSFSDGGQFLDAKRAIKHGRQLIADGADILDIGGESTRPGAKAITIQEEIDRILPVIEGLKDAGAPISVDTRHAEVMRVALASGASIINDISALTGDPASMGVAAGSEGPVILMHMQGEPGTMQDDPRYSDVVMDIFDYLDGRIGACEAAGIARSRLIVDPGIGFGQTVRHIFDVLESLAVFQALGVPLLLGVSRKRFIGAVDPRGKAGDRLGGSIAAALAGMARGAQIIRVHDVRETVQALTVAGAIARPAEWQ